MPSTSIRSKRTRPRSTRLWGRVLEPGHLVDQILDDAPAPDDIGPAVYDA